MTSSKDLFMDQRERQDLGLAAPIPPKSMYNIRQDHLSLLAAIEENEGELTPELEQALALTEEDFQNKAVSYAYVVKGFENTQDIIAKEIKRLTDLKQKAIKREELFKSRLSEAMQQFGIEKIETPTIKLSFRKSESVEITDPGALPMEYRDKPKLEDYPISKARIKEAIKEGVEVPGAELKANKNLQIK